MTALKKFIGCISLVELHKLDHEKRKWNDKVQKNQILGLFNKQADRTVMEEKNEFQIKDQKWKMDSRIQLVILRFSFRQKKKNSSIKKHHLFHLTSSVTQNGS